jgi:hypothetical protein
MEIIDGRIGEGIDLPPNARALDVLQAVYRNPSISLHTRLRAAALALPFETPKLQATAVFAAGQDFASRLEKAMLRSAKVRLIEEQPAAQTFKRRF